MSLECKECDGAGIVYGENVAHVCRDCHGTGRVFPDMRDAEPAEGPQPILAPGVRMAAWEDDDGGEASALLESLEDES